MYTQINGTGWLRSKFSQSHGWQQAEQTCIWFNQWYHRNLTLKCSWCYLFFNTVYKEDFMKDADFKCTMSDEAQLHFEHRSHILFGCWYPLLGQCSFPKPCLHLWLHKHMHQFYCLENFKVPHFVTLRISIWLRWSILANKSAGNAKLITLFIVGETTAESCGQLYFSFQVYSGYGQLWGNNGVGYFVYYQTYKKGKI